MAKHGSAQKLMQNNCRQWLTKLFGQTTPDIVQCWFHCPDSGLPLCGHTACDRYAGFVGKKAGFTPTEILRYAEGINHRKYYGNFVDSRGVESGWVSAESILLSGRIMRSANVLFLR
jgi:hypothetical protein